MKITAVIPTYNRPRLTNRALRSVLNQTVLVDEVIVVDDFSDAPFQCQKDIASKVTVLRHSKNQGVSAARNTGVKEAANDWICFLDSDDEWHENKIEEQTKDSLNNPEIKIFYTDETWIRNGETVAKQKHQQKKSGWLFEDSLKHCLIGASTLLLNKEIFEDVGFFDENLTVCEDYDFWIRITHKHEVHLNPLELISKNAGHEDQLSTKYFAMDYYRLLSLIKFKSKQVGLSNEIIFQIDSLINKKFKILKKGALKHSNNELLEKLKKIKLS